MILVITILITINHLMILSQVMLWDEQLNQEMAKAMLAEGVLVIPLRFFIKRKDRMEFWQKKAPSLNWPWGRKKSLIIIKSAKALFTSVQHKENVAMVVTHRPTL